MPIKYSDSEISQMIREAKALPDNYTPPIQLRGKRGHKERKLDVTGDSGKQYRLILRQSNFNALDFSIILAFKPTVSSQLFRLRRYNGKHGEHTNKIEGNTFYNFHIHEATERYQEIGMREDAYAEPTDRYGDYREAFHCMLHDCGFQPSSENQNSLFGGFEI